MELYTEETKKSMNDPFVERTAKTRNKKGKKVSGGIVETRSRASEDEKTMLEVDIHRNPALDENAMKRLKDHLLHILVSNEELRLELSK